MNNRQEITYKTSIWNELIDKISTVVLLLGIIFSFILVIDSDIVSTIMSMKIYGFLGIVVLFKIFSSYKITNLAPAQILILYTVVSCFGYDILVLFGGESMFNTISMIRHAYMEYFSLANALYFLGVSFLILGMLSIHKINDDSEILRENLLVTNYERDLYIKISFTIVLLYSVVLLVSVISGRLPLTNYADVREWFSTQPILSYLLRLAWVAIPTYFYFADSRNEYFKFCFPVGIMFVILMLTGNRNEILYPLAVAIGVFVWKRFHIKGKQKLPKFIVIGALFIIFVLNPLISSTRQSGFNFQTLITGSFGIESALSELGQQLNPFSIILYALDKGITSFKYGMTYIVPSVSILSLNLIFGTSYYNSSIDYNPTIILNSLGHYGRGFSYIAEFYLNFGILGIVVCMFLIGRYLGKRENATFSSRKLLFYFQIMTFFMITSRNICGYNIIVILFAIALNLFVRTLVTRNSRR